MRTSVLVAYATKQGGTAAAAASIAEVLRDNGLAAEAVHVEDVVRPERYDVVLVGSPVSRGEWRPEAADFLRSKRRALRSRPLFLFQAGLAIGDDDVIPLPRKIAHLAKKAGAIGVLTLNGVPADDPEARCGEPTLQHGVANEESIGQWAALIKATAGRRAS